MLEGALEMHVSAVVLWSEVMCNAANFSSKFDFLSFKDSSKVDWLGNSHLQMEILRVWSASTVSMEYVYMNKWTDLTLV